MSQNHLTKKPTITETQTGHSLSENTLYKKEEERDNRKGGVLSLALETRCEQTILI